MPDPINNLTREQLIQTLEREFGYEKKAMAPLSTDALRIRLREDREGRLVTKVDNGWVYQWDSTEYADGTISKWEKIGQVPSSEKAAAALATKPRMWSLKK